MESGGQTFIEKCQTDGFRAHLWRIEHGDDTYHFEVEYLVDPQQASPLPDNYMQSYQRHKQLRSSYGQLPVETKAEFRDRLTNGLAKGYWRILEENEALHLRDTDGLYLPANFALKKAGTTKARLVLDPSGSLNGALLKAPNLEQKIASVLRRIQATPILLSADVKEAFFKIKVAPASRHLSLFLMDYDEATKVLQPKVTESSKLVTVQALSLIMGVSQSPCWLSLSFENLATTIPDQLLRWFLKYMRYLDDIQIGITAEEIKVFQDKTDLKDPELDSFCCPNEADLSPANEEVLGEEVPADEQRATRHLFRNKTFGKQIFHLLILRAATLEAALIKADLPTKEATTSLQQHFQHEFVNAARCLYTSTLLKGETPEFTLLVKLTPPAHMEVWEPDYRGRPRRWYRPWTTKGNQEGPPAPPLHLQEEEPILKMADHPSDPAKLTCEGATLLGYRWNLENDCLSSGKNLKINLLPARRGIRPAWADLEDAEGLLHLHHKRPLTQRQALAMAHHHFDPLQSQPFLSMVLKFMYRYLVLSNSLSEELEGYNNFNKVLTDDFVRDHLQPAVSLAIATKRRLGQRRTWRLPPCIDQSTIRTSVEFLADGAWGSLCGECDHDIFSAALSLHGHTKSVYLSVLSKQQYELHVQNLPPD